MRGAHPEVMRRLVETNMEATAGYGADEYTARASRLILERFGVADGEVTLLVGGTQTNATVIDALLRRGQSVLAVADSHINVHEAGAIEADGHKVTVLPDHDGKLSGETVDRYVADFYADATWPHKSAPGMVYISFPTELGTVYTLRELEELSAACRRHGLPLYLDGARLGYGLESEGCDVTPADIGRLCDVFYIGGTKGGALFGEAVVATRKGLLPGFFTLVKSHGALLAKGRLLGLQFETLMADDLYFRISRHAVEMAMLLREAMTSAGYRTYIDSPTNQQFFLLPNADIERLRGVAGFELWGPLREGETPVRFVTDWSTREEEIEELRRHLLSENKK